MRHLMFAAAVIAAGLAVGPRDADAEPLPHFPYCLFTGGDLAGFERCNYATFEQCLFDRRAEGGVCYSNPYPVPLGAPRPGVYTR